MHKPAPPPFIALICAGLFALSTLVLVVMVVANGGQVAQLRVENEQLRQRTEHLSNALARFNEDQNDVVTVIEELETELADVRRSYVSLGETAEEARQRLEAANERLDQLATLEDETLRLNRANQELEERNSTLVDRLEASRDELERLHEEVSNLSEPNDAAVRIY